MNPVSSIPKVQNMFTYKSPNNLCSDVGTVPDIQCTRPHLHIFYRHWPHFWSQLCSGNGSFRCWLKENTNECSCRYFMRIPTYWHIQHSMDMVDGLYRTHIRLCPHSFCFVSTQSQVDIDKRNRQVCSYTSATDHNWLHVLHIHQCQYIVSRLHSTHIHSGKSWNWYICSHR